VAMVLGRVMLGEIVGHVGATGLPMDSKMALADAVKDPIESHVDGVGSVFC
jgi:hypothetical protein